MSEETTVEFDLSGGELCLDFVNTVGGSRHGTPKEHMPGYAELISFSRQTGLIDGKQHADILNEASKHPQEAAEVYQRAYRLRESLFRIFDALASGHKPAGQDLDDLNFELSKSLHRLKILLKEDGFEWGWETSQTTLDMLLGPIASSAANLLTSNDLHFVRECGGENCSWLFIDRTKNHSRVWCDMKGCGNRAKVRRHRQRISKAKEKSPGETK